MMTETERFAGCLVGQCLGDALGFVVEGYPPEVCADYVDNVLRAGRAGALGRGPFPFGQYTDDSQLARELLVSAVARGGFDPTDYAQRVAALFTEGRIVGRGATTEQAALRVAAGVPWDQAGAPPPAAGNGSAMRAGPVGLLCHGDDDQLRRVACEQSIITHQDVRSQAGSVAIAGAVSLCLAGEPFDRATFAARLAALVAPVDAAFAAFIGQLDAWAARPPAEVAPEIRVAGMDPNHPGAWPGISPFVIASVLWSLYSFMRHPDDYWEAICTAIAVGGDVDTTAAMTGAISGAHLGLAALPAALTHQLGDRGTWGYDELLVLSARAQEVGTAP